MEMGYFGKLFFPFSIFLICSVSLYAETWRADFDRLCSYTQEAEALSVKELKDLIAECDKLLEVIQKSDIAEKKVYLFRLKKCRNFFDYILSIKGSQERESGQ
jgi:hypothetical protein